MNETELVPPGLSGQMSRQAREGEEANIATLSANEVDGEIKLTNHNLEPVRQAPLTGEPASKEGRISQPVFRQLLW